MASLKIVSVLLILAVTIISSLSAGCSKNNAEKQVGNTGTSEIMDTGSIKYLNIGVDSTFPPFAFLMEDKVSGFDIDIAGELAKRLGRELKIKQLSWNEIFNRINDADIDAIISGVSVSADRLKSADFSEPYYTLEFVSLVLNSSSIKLEDELTDRKIGMLKNEMEDLSSDILSNYSLAGYDDIVELIKALKAEEVQGILISIPIGAKILSEDPDTYRYVHKIESGIKYSIVLKKGSPLTEKINQALKDMQEDGTYKIIYGNWFKI